MHSATHGPTAVLLGMLLLCSAAVGALQQERPGVVQGLPDTIPLRLLLGNAKYRNPQLDNTGNYIAFIRPDSSGVQNVFAMKLPDRPQLAAMDQNRGLLDQLAGKAERQVTFDSKRGVTSYSWAEDDSTMFYLQDEGGDENYHLFMVDVSQLFVDGSSNGGQGSVVKAKDLTPYKDVKVMGIITSERVPRKIYFSMNKRDASVFDLYTLDLDTLDIGLYAVNPGDVASWLVDFDFRLRGLESYNSSDGATYVQVNDELISRKPSSSSSSSSPSIQEESGPSKGRVMPVADLFKAAEAGNWTIEQWINASTSRQDLRKWRVLLKWPFGEDNGVYRFNRDGTALYGTSLDNRDTSELVLYSTAPGAKVLQRIAGSPLCNVGSVVFNPESWEPQAVSFNYLRPRWQFLDPDFEKLWARLAAFKPGRDPSIASRTPNSKAWIISYNADNHTTAMYLYQAGVWPPQLLLEMQPDLNNYQMASMHSVVIPARDGQRLPGYLTLPRKASVPAVLPACVVGPVPDLREEAKRAVDSSTLKCPLGLNLPLVLFVHGGPWSRDTWGADSVVQFLANCGYGVLQINYRGSTGYGKSFLNAGNRQWGVGVMQHDLTDSVRWAIEKGIADPKKVCIFGGSYGGYASLAGLAFTPELYACGVSMVGVSNVGTFLKSIPAYWRPLRIDFVNRVGDAEANSTLNREISPVFHVANVRAPLLIGQGANDPRVPKRESDQMFAAMKAKGLDVEYILYPDEGHGFMRPDNRLDFYSRMEHFLSKRLGGRTEPLLKLEKSSAQVVTNV